MKSFELTVAPNGARRGRRDHPALPLTSAETAATAAACQRAGADALHLHVRDGAGRHSLDAGRYREAMAAVGELAPGMAVQITTEAAGIYDVAAQHACLAALRPGAASISVREMARDAALAARVYALCDEAGTRVQHILYGPGCIRQLAAWRRAGVIRPGQNEVLCVLGQYAPAIPGRPDDLAGFLSLLQGQSLRWAACAFGGAEQACLLKALALGGDVRIGFENNLRAPDGTLFADNAASVAAFLAAAGYAPKTRA
ncbi:3-keto-5-aminohexanoate cleavage protein [Shimia sp.]|uniref:3-keto-5-aminohexanoate cleavage protein n=1 Tax=Shimia sp. TaxID=1954381 RepID=UPI00356484AA